MDCRLSMFRVVVVVMVSFLFAPHPPAHSQEVEAEMVGVGFGDWFYSRDYPVGFAGIIEMAVGAEIVDTFCIDYYLPIWEGQTLLINGPLTDLREDVDWCSVNYILNNFVPSDNNEAGAIQCAIWYFATAPHGPYNGSGAPYQFMSDPSHVLPYDAWSYFTGPQLRQRAFEIIGSVPVGTSGDCLARFPEAVDLQPDTVIVTNCEKQDVLMTATVYDQHGEPMPGQTVHILTEDGQLSVETASGRRVGGPKVDPCSAWFPAVQEVTAVTDDQGVVSVLFSACGTAETPVVDVWVAGQYGTLLFDRLGLLQPLSTLSLQPFSIADSSLIVCENRRVPEGAVGCSHGFWKAHPGSWKGYRPEDLLIDVFGVPVGPGWSAEDTLMDALEYQGGNDVGGASRNLLQQGVGALLNAVHSDVSFSLTQEEVLVAVADALASLDREVIIALAEDLDEANNLGCGEGGGSPGGNKE